MSEGTGRQHLRLQQADLDSAVTWTLTRAARHVERKLTAVIASHGLTPVQYGVLAQLATNDSMTRAQLARATNTRPQSMAGVIEGMVEKGMIAFAGASGKGRPNPVQLTEAGHSIIDVVWPAVLESNQAQPLGLSDAEAVALNATLHRLLQN